jgi:hypothetical protein
MRAGNLSVILQVARLHQHQVELTNTPKGELITQRSQVQILPPLPKKPQVNGLRFSFALTIGAGMWRVRWSLGNAGDTIGCREPGGALARAEECAPRIVDASKTRCARADISARSSGDARWLHGHASRLAEELL